MPRGRFFTPAFFCSQKNISLIILFSKTVKGFKGLQRAERTDRAGAGARIKSP